MKQSIISALSTVLLTASCISAGIISTMEPKWELIIVVIVAVFIGGAGMQITYRPRKQDVEVERKFYNFDLSKGREE